MATVQFTRHLNRFFPDLSEVTVEAATVRELISKLDADHPGLADYLVDDHGALRKHVNVFVGDDLVRDRQQLSDTLGPESTVFIIQALSGG